MAHVTIIGPGNMGQAIAGIVAKSGNTVELISEQDADKPVTGDIVVLAVYYPAIDQIIAKHGADLAGKIVVDITNPINFETLDGLVVPADSSAAAEIAAKLPDSTVLKAFNTTFAGTLSSGVVGGNPTTVLVAGDDADAKSLLVGIVTAAGLKGIDVGSLRRARELEAMGFLEIALAASEKIAWTGGFAVIQ